MADEILSPEEMEAVEALIDDWLGEQLAENPIVAAVDKHREPLSSERLWRVRVTGDQKDVFAVWYRLRQRTLHVETYFMPAPEENQAELYEQLLRRNQRFNGLAFCIGGEEAVFLAGRFPLRALARGELDRLLGSVYAYVEQCFRPAIRVGFASTFGDR
jgi:hypothetical protein